MPVVAQSLFWCPRAPALPLLLPHAYCRVFRLSRPPAPSPNRMSDTAVKLDSRSSARMCTAISGKQAMVFRLVPRTTWSWLYATPRGNRAATLASGTNCFAFVAGTGTSLRIADLRCLARPHTGRPGRSGNFGGHETHGCRLPVVAPAPSSCSARPSSSWRPVASGSRSR